MKPMGNDRLAKLRSSHSSSILVLPMKTGSRVRSAGSPAFGPCSRRARGYGVIDRAHVERSRCVGQREGRKTSLRTGREISSRRGVGGTSGSVRKILHDYPLSLSQTGQRCLRDRRDQEMHEPGPIEGPEGCCSTGVNEQSLANLILDNAVGLITGGGEFAQYAAKKDHTFQRQVQVPEVAASELIEGRFYVDGDLVYDYRLGLVWSKRSKTDARFSRADAIGYVEKVFSVQGYKNWRLPSPLEMQSLYYDVPERQNGPIIRKPAKDRVPPC